jgi:murein DD-endopeptidase MepM/ murein hydrolase activator NlpD
MFLHKLTLFVALGVAVAACGVPEALRPSLKDAPTHERYTDALSEFGLDTVALGQDWLSEAQRALTSPLAAPAPFIESGVFPADRPTAVGYRLDLTRGRKLAIDLSFESNEPGRLFVDLFEVREGQPPRRVGGAEPGQFSFEHDVRWTGPHILRLQPELLRFGRYTITQRTLASYTFPIPDRSLNAVKSGFGAPRDGGARDHHGIDIFAPRGTPVVAIADGYVQTDETPRGGRVVWLRDSRLGRNLYYAHLNDWAVESGTQVRVGDVIGYVGNTGNARTTPPHLHFGIYERGPTDPAPYLWRDDPRPAKLTLSLEPLGARVDGARVLAAQRNGYRLVQPDGSFTVVSARALQTDRP